MIKGADFLKQWNEGQKPYEGIVVTPCFILTGRNQRYALKTFLRHIMQSMNITKEFHWGLMTQGKVQILGTAMDIMRMAEPRTARMAVLWTFGYLMGA